MMMLPKLNIKTWIFITLALIGQSTPVVILLFAGEAWVFYLFAVILGLCYEGEMLGASTGMALGAGWVASCSTCQERIHGQFWHP